MNAKFYLLAQCTRFEPHPHRYFELPRQGKLLFPARENYFSLRRGFETRAPQFTPSRKITRYTVLPKQMLLYFYGLSHLSLFYVFGLSHLSNVLLFYCFHICHFFIFFASHICHIFSICLSHLSHK